MEAGFNREADELIGGKRYAEARALLEGVLAGMPEGWQPARTEGRALYITFWDEDEFLAYVGHAHPGERMVVWARGSYSKAWYQLAVVAYEQERVDEALFCVERGLQLEPDQPELWSEKGYLLGVRKEYREALACYQRAATVRSWLSPTQLARALRGQAVQLIDLELPESAEALLRRSLELEPDSHVARNELQYIDDLRRRRGEMPWYVQALLYPPADPLTASLLAMVEDLPPVPGPATLGPQGFSQVLNAFMKRGWPGFEEEFDRLVPRGRSNYTDLKRDLLREPMFNPRTHQKLAELAAGEELHPESEAPRPPRKVQ